MASIYKFITLLKLVHTGLLIINVQFTIMLNLKELFFIIDTLDCSLRDLFGK